MTTSASASASAERPRISLADLSIVAALIIGSLVRIAMWLSEKSFWGDEWFSIDLACAPSLTETVVRAVRDVHPPLYYLVLRLAVQIFGHAEPVFRSVSFAAGLGTLWILVILTRRYIKTAAPVCAWIAALSPYWLQSGNEVRSYALMAFLVVAGSYAFCRSREVSAAAGWRSFYAVTALSAIYTEHYAWFWVSAITGYLIVERFRGKGVRGDLRAQCVIIGCGLPSLVLIGYQAVVGERVFDITRVGQYWNPGWMVKKIAGIFWHLSSGYEFAMLTTDRVVHYARHSPYFWASALAAILGLVCFMRGLTALRKGASFFFWMAFLGFLVPAVFLWIFYPIRLHARYLSFAAPWFFVTVSAGVCRMPRWFFAAATAGLLAVGSVGVYGSVRSLTDRVHREDYLNQTRYILTHAQADDAVAGLEPQFLYYQKKLGAGFSGKLFSGIEALGPENLRGTGRVWLSCILNMDPGVNERMLKNIRKIMLELGYKAAGEPVVFGGAEALTMVYCFEKKSS